MLKKLQGLKYLLAAGLIFGCAVFVSHQYQTARKQCAEKCKQVYPRTITPSSPAENCDKCEQDAERNFPRWYRLFGWPEGIETWAILLTLLAIGEQTYQTRRAADAGADAANAAYGSVRFAEAQFELTKEERRARISIKAIGIQVQDPESEFWNLVTYIEIRNLGQTRAFIKRTGGEFAIRADGDEGLQEDDIRSLYLSDEYIDPSTTPVVVSLHQFNLLPTSLKVLADDIHDRRRTFYLYGFIEYETLGMRFKEEFDYFWLAGSMLGMLGIEEKNLTDRERVEQGHWWDNHPHSENDK